MQESLWKALLIDYNLSNVINVFIVNCDFFRRSNRDGETPFFFSPKNLNIETI